MKIFLATSTWLVTLFLTACSLKLAPLLEVNHQILRDDAKTNYADDLIQHEKDRMLFGAISQAERKQKLGQYYTFLWNDPTRVGTGDVQLQLFYQQGSTGPKVKCKQWDFSSLSAKGKAEFFNVGDDFLKKGRVLAWKLRLKRGPQVIAEKRSYLWRD